MKNGRPKGSKQKVKDLSKYWLPDGVVLSDNNAEVYAKEDILEFIDETHGRFKSSFKGIQRANASTHPESIKIRKQKTIKEKYGVDSISQVKEFRQKAESTMLKKYGVKHALKNPKFLKKSKDTLMGNWGVENPMQSVDIVENHQQSLMDKYGVNNVMKVPSVQKKVKETCLERFGYDNPSKSPKIRAKIVKANLNNFESKGEKSLRDYVESLGIVANKGYIGGADPKELDIVIKEKSIAIEYNGAYWHSEANKKMDKHYHYNKYKACLNKGLKLIQVFDYEWDNRKFQVKSFLRSALGKNEIKVNARDCEFREVKKEEATEFIEKYHIIGKCRFTKAYGLYLKDELLAVGTIGNHHRNLKQKVLSRFCVKYNVNLRGALGKISTNIYKREGSLITWIDFRFSNGDNWVNQQWKLVGILKPDYCYIDTKNSLIIPKQARMKSKVGTPDDMSESDHAKTEGLYRIWDVGKMRLKLG